MRIAKIVNSSTSSLGYQMFMSIAKLIPDNPSRDTVKLAFDILAGSESFTRLSESLPPPLCDASIGEIDPVGLKLGLNDGHVQRSCKNYARHTVLSAQMTGKNYLQVTIQLNQSTGKALQITLSQFH